MPSVHVKSPCPPRARRLAVAVVTGAALVAGCGTSTPTTTVLLSVGSPPASTVAASASGGSGSSPSAADDPALQFARCMRAHGVPNFPDPADGGGPRFDVGAVTSVSTPAFRAAQAKCARLMPDGPPIPGAQTHPSAQTLSQLLRIARCMRQHRVPQFPDPRTSVPPDPSGIQQISDFDGAILLFPSTIDLEAPAYRQALTACGAPPLGLPH